MTDAISREAAKEAILERCDSLMKEVLTNDALPIRITQGMRRTVHTMKEAIAILDTVPALDALPAVGAEERWRLLEDGIRQLSAAWGSRGINERTIGVEHGYSPSCICREELKVLLRSLGSRCAASSPAQPEAARVERPPMLLVTLCKGWSPEWWIRHGEVWRQTSGAETRSRHIYSVDRTASDPEALKLYDADLAP